MNLYYHLVHSYFLSQLLTYTQCFVPLSTIVTAIDECADRPCVHGVCVDGYMEFTCTCDPGFTGHTCDAGLYDTKVSVVSHATKECVIISSVLPGLGLLSTQNLVLFGKKQSYTTYHSASVWMINMPLGLCGNLTL